MSFPRSFITESTFRFLEPKLEDANHEGTYRRLLRDKLANTVILQPSEIPPDVATLNSRIDYSVDGKGHENRVLVRSEAIEVFGLHLSITTLRGLALLGLTEGDAVELTRLDGRLEIIGLIKVCYQPEVQQRLEQRRKNAGDAAQDRPFAFGLDRTGQAKHFNSKDQGEEIDDDDPGPRAA